MLDVQLAVAGIIENLVVGAESRVLTTAVDGVIAAERIESLPLNGRNSSSPCSSPQQRAHHLFDPTKSNRVLVGSAGQLGRGGNITIDGQDNNDDVVGGPLLNLPIDAVQEFQIATNRFGADLGRSAASAINVITRSGANARHGAPRSSRATTPGSAAIDAGRCRARAPFDRQQMSGAFGGPLRRDRLFWFAAGEFRHQNGGVLVGTRNTATRTITTSFAPAPLRDSLWSLRLDTAGSGDRLSVRYAGEWGTDTSASAIERAIGSATQRQDATNRYHNVLGTWTPAPSNRSTNPERQCEHVPEPDAAGGHRAAADVPQPAGRRLVPHAPAHHADALQVSDSATFIRGPHSLRVGGELHQIYGEFNLGVFQQGRIELVEDFPTFDHTGDGRIDDNDLLFAVTLRSGKPTQSRSISPTRTTRTSPASRRTTGGCRTACR